MQYGKAVRAIGLWGSVLAAVVLGQTCCAPIAPGDDNGDQPGGTDGSSNDNSLIGTWNLVSQNGQVPGPGVYLRWEFTATTVTITSDLDCTEVLTYGANGGTLSTLSVMSREGTQCGPDDEVGDLGTYSVVGDTLTVTVTDPEVTPPTIVSVFTKAP